MKKKIIGVLGAMLLSGLLFTGGSAFATHDEPGTLHACVGRNRSPMRWVQSPDDCRRREMSISWAGSVSGGLVSLPTKNISEGFTVPWYENDFVTVYIDCRGASPTASLLLTTTADAAYSSRNPGGEMYGWVTANSIAVPVSQQVANGPTELKVFSSDGTQTCLLYTSDAADE